MSTLPAKNTPTILLAQDLISRPSITPLDSDCQTILASRLNKMGFSLQAVDFENVSNLWAIRGTQEPLFVFAGHTDVVPPGNLNEWTSPPFSPEIRSGALFGRGAADMKGSLAAMVTACERFIQNNPNHSGSIAFLLTSDEEGPAQWGTAKVIEKLKEDGIKIDYCLIGEPTSINTLGDTLKNGRRGSLNGILKIFGIQGHIAYPENAENPIHSSLLPLAELLNIEWDQGSKDFQATQLQFSNIHAGVGATNVIPGYLECQFNFRFNPESTPETLLARMKSILDAYPIRYKLNSTTSGFPFITRSGQLVEGCVEAIQEILNITPSLSTNGGTSDGRFIAPTGAQVVELGPCNATIHRVNEQVEVSELNNLSLLYERILEKMLLSV